MSAFPISYAGTSADDALAHAVRELRILSAASSAADEGLRRLSYTDISNSIDAVIDMIEPIIDYLNTVDHEGCIEQFANCRRRWIERKGGAK